MSRPQIGPRVQRMLSLIPWLKAHPEGVPIEEVCARFGVDQKRLLADIEALAGVGSAPQLPGDVVEVVVERGRVFAFVPLSFTKPLRLTPAQALSLVAAGSALLPTNDAAADDPLRRALAKLAVTLGIDVDDAVAVDLGAADSAHLDAINRALTTSSQVELEYYSASRDDVTTRVVDPFQLVSMGGHWYLSGWCRTAQGERLFRVDRVTSVRVLDLPAEAHPDRESLSPLHYDADTPRVTLGLAPHVAWIADTFPTDAAEVADDGSVQVVLPVASRHWLLRLLLQWGPGITVVSDPHGLCSGVAEAAATVLSRYAGDAGRG